MKKVFLILLILSCFSLFGTTAFVLNSGSQTLSKIDFVSGQVNNAFSPVGLYANRVGVTNDFVYVVNSGDNSVQKIDIETGQTITNIFIESSSNPYDIIFSQNYAYVTGLFTSKVYKINLDTDIVEDEINVGISPEGMAIYENKLYVANTGYQYPSYGQGTVSVVNLDLFEVEKTIDVGMNPQALTVYDDEIHVVCTGNYYDVLGEVFIIDSFIDEVSASLEIGGCPTNITASPLGIVYLGDGMGAGVYSYDASYLEILHSPQNLFSSGGSAIAINEDIIAVTDAGNWASNSIVRIYNLDEELINEYTTAIGAVDIKFFDENVNAQDDSITKSSAILGDNYPNPFNPSTTIQFTTEHTENTETCPPWRIIIYNIKGQKIRQYSIFNNQSSIVWDGTDENNQPVGSGVYFYQLKLDDQTVATKKMMLLK